MSKPSVLILGGGLSGAATAWTLAREGLDVALVERGSRLGGLAGSFERAGHFYPLGYHHIVHQDRTLLFFLDAVGALASVRWRRIQMYFRVGGVLYDLARPLDFLRFPMPLLDKLLFVRLMLRAFTKRDWSDWIGRSGSELVEHWATPRVREALFEPLCRLKFDLRSDQVSGAWIGTRLHHREGSAALGYIPDANWTKVLCDGVTRLLAEAGVAVRLDTPVEKLWTREGRVHEVELAGGERVGADLVVSTLPTEVYGRLAPEDATRGLREIRYTALVSAICATRQPVSPDFYWMNLVSLDRNAGGIFRLDGLNPTIGEPGDTCLNFVNHVRDRSAAPFQRSDDELWAGYRQDFRDVFGAELEPFWTHVTRVPMYSPIFHPTYRNPPLRSESLANVWFAGNYRTFPSLASTGTALGSGVETGAAILADLARGSDLPQRIAAFRLRSMPRP